MLALQSLFNSGPATASGGRRALFVRYSRWFALSTGLIALVATASYAQSLDQQLDDLLRKLNANEASLRDEAERALIELAPIEDTAASDAFLEKLPRPIEGMPEEVQLRLARVRQQIESRQATQVLSPSRLTLRGEGVDLAVLFEQVAEQTGNNLADYRSQFGQPAEPKTATLAVEDQEFWPTIDKILDDAELSLYPYSGENALAYVQREPGAAARAEHAVYSGPFRIEVVNVLAQRGMRNPGQQGLQVELEIAWEPRLKPIALTQPVDKLQVTTDAGNRVPLANPQAVLGVEVQPGSYATELNLPLELPPRSVERLATFQGELSVLLPVREVEFRFDQLEQAAQTEQQSGGVVVTLQLVRKNQALWEVHMRLRVESEEAGLESHRGWVFQNITLLEDQEGEALDHVGYETTMQTEREIGLAYLFELPEGKDINDYTWVYRTPAAILRVPVKYELKDIELP